MSQSARTASAWYAAGLRFKCTRCGNCCSGAPGYVWVTEEECHEIAAFRDMSFEQFASRHVRRVGDRLSLLEERDGDCEFLLRDPDGLTRCSIHPVRPVQCRTWPFWKSNLRSPRNWEAAGKGCPGIDTGDHHPLPVIRAALQSNGALPL